jgi:RimJ/RimL family protein N-acetyltransferase
MWREVLKPEFTVSKGCVITKNNINGTEYFDFPLPIDDESSIDGALDEISEYCRENYVVFRLSNVPENQLTHVTSRFPRCEITYNRKFSDYVYLTSKLAEMSGRAYSGHRNHIKKFKTKYPDAVFREFTRDDIPSVKQFLKRFSNSFALDTESASDELRYSEEMLAHIGSSCFKCGGYVLDGEIISLCFCERCGDTLIDHIEKALYEFEGIYPATVQAFLLHFGDDTRYFNREDDSGDRGLRTSKLQYKPHMIAHKYIVTIKNELSSVEAHPELSSDRLTYSSITQEDIDEYNRLCLDIERNRYWGYDYRTDNENPDKDYFYLDQRRDFDNRMTMCLAVRLRDKMIGEVILHNFDYHGGCEIGIRILPEYKGQGYGRETLNTIIQYALYDIGLDIVRAKCYKENRPSSNMLSTVMRSVGEDEIFEYYVCTF